MKSERNGFMPQDELKKVECNSRRSKGIVQNGSTETQHKRLIYGGCLEWKMNKLYISSGSRKKSFFIFPFS